MESIKLKAIRFKVKRTCVILASCVFILCSLILVPAKAQTWNELFKQKETQKKYLLEQIVALKVYASYLKKGYDITSSGLQTVKDITKGEFNLHNAFISSLKTVSPAIRSHVKVAEIIAMQIEIGKAFSGLRNNSMLPLANQLYIEDVKDKVIDECLKDLEELLLVIASGKVEMTDDERIKRLDKVYGAMKDKSAFTQSFYNEINLLIRQKASEQQSINQLKKIYEIN